MQYLSIVNQKIKYIRIKFVVSEKLKTNSLLPSAMQEHAADQNKDLIL
jgi:hypothetical protein